MLEVRCVRGRREREWRGVIEYSRGYYKGKGEGESRG